MTSNLGSHLIQEQLMNLSEEKVEEIMGDLRYKLTQLLRKTIRPEFLNRIDEIVLFKPLTKNEIRAIVDIQIQHVQNLLKDKEIILDVDEESRDWLAKLGYDVTYGARPLKRTIQKYLTNPLSQEMLMGNFNDGDTIKVTVGLAGKLKFSKAEVVEET